MTFDDQLQAYVDGGCTITPLHPGSKQPIYNDWPNRPTELGEFTPDLNVGLVLGKASSGRVDADLDDPAAIIAAEYLFPPTNTIFGRDFKTALSPSLQGRRPRSNGSTQRIERAHYY